MSELSPSTVAQLEVSRTRLESYRNAYTGRRCFILGTGPSINLTPLHLLRNELCFAVNRLYLKFDDSFSPDFYVCGSALLQEQWAAEINAVRTQKFLGAKGSSFVNFDERTILLNVQGHMGFSRDVALEVFEGASVVFIALQLAFYMGFSQAYLAGVDHSYSLLGHPGEDGVIVSDKLDVNHFDQSYFPLGSRIRAPYLEVQDYAFKLAKLHWQSAGRSVFNATAGGQLEVFERVSFESLFV